MDQYQHPRVAALWDRIDERRSDLDPYVALALELRARTVLDVGCGTGTLALRLASHGLAVIGVDPAAASLALAADKPGSERVRWVAGTAPAVDAREIDLVTMTGNVAQAIIDPRDWHATLGCVHDALAPAGRLAVETRDPEYRAWREWNRRDSYRVVRTVDGPVATWYDLVDVSLPLVTFRSSWQFPEDLVALDAMLRFRTREEVAADLARHGLQVTDVRDAPDRPGREFVFLARRRDEAA